MEEKKTGGLAKYRRMGDLSMRKLKEYIPAMLMTNLSTLLLVTVDGVVAGNLVGEDALASINIFAPVSILVGSLSVLTSTGISVSISTAMGKNDPEELDRVKGISLRVLILVAAAAAFIQIPLVWMILRSYGLSPEMFAMTMQYAAGIMLCTPLGIISSTGTYQLQIAGKMKVLMRLTVMEGIANLLFDLFFMGVLDIGVGGAGFGTACANLLRCTVTVFYISRYTDMYRSNTKKITVSDALEVLGVGVPDASYRLIQALQSYLVMKIILAALGTRGAVIKGVCSLCYSLTNVLTSGVSGSMRPLMGLYTGADDKEGVSILMKQGVRLDVIAGGLATLVIELHPEWIYHINGVHDIPEGGMLAVRLFSLVLVVGAINTILRMYLTNRKDSAFATMTTVVCNATLPAFAFLLWKSLPAPYVFLAYLLTDLTVFAVSYARYRKWMRDDREELEKNGEDIVLNMTVGHDDAVEASRQIRKFADEHGINEKISYRVALCMEEMVAYVKEAETTGLKERFGARGDSAAGRTDDRHDSGLNVDVVVRFKGKDEAVFVTMDSGRCIALDKDEEAEKLITDNYGLLRKLAKSVEYQYILDLNYTRFTF